MLNLYTIAAENKTEREFLSDSEVFSVIYHDVFDYPLSFPDLIRWKSGKQLPVTNYPASPAGRQFSITNKNGFYFLEGREGLIYKRILRERISKKKLEIAKKAAKILSFLLTVRMVGVTGSLAMGNSADGGDIDLMIIVKKGALWTTRAFAYMVIHAFGFSPRKPNDLHQKDKLCLNMWLDESDLVWKKDDRNVYSAHEIGQILPLVNENRTYEKFLQKNKWILDYWPNSVKVNDELRTMNHDEEPYSLVHIASFIPTFVEKFAFWLQYRHMKSKITRETVTPTRALFHPQDWGRMVLDRLI